LASRFWHATTITTPRSSAHRSRPFDVRSSTNPQRELPDEVEKRTSNSSRRTRATFAEFIGHELQKARSRNPIRLTPEPVDRYVDYADAGSKTRICKAQDTARLSIASSEPGADKIENACRRANTKDYTQRGRQVLAAVAGPSTVCKEPSWTSYEKNPAKSSRNGYYPRSKDLLPVISFGTKKDGDTEKKHGAFVAADGGERLYPSARSGRLVEWITCG